MEINQRETASKQREREERKKRGDKKLEKNQSFSFTRGFFL